MKRLVLSAICLIVSQLAMAQYAPAGDSLKTRWASEITPENVWQEYPRPQMYRLYWENLNGLWDYAIRPKGENNIGEFDGKILVPFCVESSLSGVQKYVGKDKELWYQREFDYTLYGKEHLLLHFGAVDWECDVWVNDIKVGSHTGGYTPFTFDITQAVKKKGNVLKVRVWDPTDQGEQPCGKQHVKPHGIWYTPVTGIWQTVWLEVVANETYIEDLKIIPDIDNQTVTVIPEIVNASRDIKVKVEVYAKNARGRNKIVSKGRSINGETVEVAMPVDAILWSPDNPFLYGVDVSVYKGNKLVDYVISYFAMRKFSTEKDENGIVRLMLNNEPIFMFGPLDQGWWCDGLYTAPCDEALRYDIEKTKDFGYNMIRKHVKVEPARWYYWCDRLGIIVWQDMPSGGKGPEWVTDGYFDGSLSRRTPESEATYKKEWKEIIDYLYSVPSIGVWVPFNESWGQFKTPEIVEWTKSYDPSRLVNPASGGNHYPVGDILDIHNYPDPEMYFYEPERVTVLGEYGGIGRKIEGHTWVKDQGWGYVEYDTEEKVTDTYVEYANELLELIPQGFSAAVYTQTTDCEVELNGLMTYDRAVVKMNEQRIREINLKISNYFKK
ncbi:MAG: beta-galactosidase [Bacteroidales bacterium]|nr:beta-galactosidase [Bacteroidales bacterium]